MNFVRTKKTQGFVSDTDFSKEVGSLGSYSRAERSICCQRSDVAVFNSVRFLEGLKVLNHPNVSVGTDFTKCQVLPVGRCYRPLKHQDPLSQELCLTVHGNAE